MDNKYIHKITMKLPGLFEVYVFYKSEIQCKDFTY